MKIYHYARLDDYPGIKHGSWKSGGEPGLGPSRRVCQYNFDDEGARDGAVFGLLEPEPTAWVDNKDFPLAWQVLKSNVGRLLLSYDVSDQIADASSVIDWAHMERMLGGYKDDLAEQTDQQETCEDRRAAEGLYWGSRLPLAEYIDDPAVISGIALPEVITMCHVPFEAIEVSEVQPKLEDMPPFVQEDLEALIGRNPELEMLSSYLTVV